MASSSSSHRRSLGEYQRESYRMHSSEKLYDAFISHRGPDAKQTVAFALYDSLEEKGFRTFLDDQEIQLGDSLESAIRNGIHSSAVQIAIFSPGYAESPWCLDELLDMLKANALFIPVFCDVKPSDLRYPHKGVYAPAFAQHQEKGRFGNERLQQWEEALQHSSGISGYEFSTSNEFGALLNSHSLKIASNVEMLCTKIAWAVEKVVGKTRNGFPRYGEGAKDQICLRADSEVSTSTPRQVSCSLLPNDSHPVGIHSKVEDMISLLEDPQFPVIAVVGMGGLGKTFLVQNVFNKTKSSFDPSIWLSISKSYSVKNLQHDIASHIGLQDKIVGGGVTEGRAAELIHECLQGKRYFIVLDDLWELSTEDDLLYKLGLPIHNDCKVVVTTRNKEVAQNSKAYVYEMKIMSDEDSWKLFCAHAFPHFEAPSHLGEVGREIVKQCGNLPLALKTTAASLAKTTRLSKWESKRDQLKKPKIPFGGRDPVMDILKLSYDSLPRHLKPGFAYLSFFPEGEEIDPEYLVYLWIAEGLIPAGEEQWDTAWDWIDQLVQLCLLQLWEDQHSKDRIHRLYFSISQDRVKSLARHYKVHDLLHDLAIHISRENNCAFSLVEASTHTSTVSGCCRILLAKKCINANDISESRPAYLRTLSLSQNVEITSIPKNLFNAMRGLRILDLSSTRISALPAYVGKMILLKVLNLKDTWLDKVPECVRYLKSLLFLAVTSQRIVQGIILFENTAITNLVAHRRRFGQNDSSSGSRVNS